MAVTTRVLLSPRMLVLHVVAVLAVVAAALLGRWQYGVWQGDRVDQATLIAHAAPRPLDRVLGPDSPFPADAVGRPVSFRGRWLPADTLYVAHRHLHGRAGVWVVTPVAVCHADCAKASAMLVVRGFAGSPHAAPPAPSGLVTVTGWLQPGETGGAVDPRPHDDVIPQLQVVDAIPHIRQDLYGGYVIAKAAGSAGLTRLSPQSLPKPSSWTGLRNLVYAFQWWVFGGFAVFLWWRWCRDEVSRVTGVRSRE